MSAPKILVTGVAGFIGSHTAIELLSKGFDVIGIDNFCNSDLGAIDRLQQLKAQELGLVGPEFKHYSLDVRDAKSLEALFAQHTISCVIHFAGLKSVAESFERPLDYWDTNVLGTMNLLKVMQKNNVKRFLFSSSATVYARTQCLPIKEDAPLLPCSPYGRTKWVCEQFLQDFSSAHPEWNISLLRYFNPVGAHESGLLGEHPKGEPNNLMPIVTQVAAGLREKLLVFGNDYDTPDGTCIRDYIHVVDLAQGHVAVAMAMGLHTSRTEIDTAPNQHSHGIQGLTVLNFGTGQGVSVKNLIETFSAVTGKKIPYEFVARRSGDLPAYYADASSAKELVGWKAQRGLEKMCSDAWRWQLNFY